MTKSFVVDGNVAELKVDLDGYEVMVKVTPPRGATITVDDASVVLTRAIPYFPQLARFPEPLRGGFQTQVYSQPRTGREPRQT